MGTLGRGAAPCIHIYLLTYRVHWSVAAMWASYMCLYSQ